MDGARLGLFVSAAAILALTPGPGILYVLNRALHGGRREGILSACGTFVGGLVQLAAAALGLSTILAMSAMAFEVVRYAGAAYLIYLGIAMIRNRNVQPTAPDDTGSSRKPILQGITTEILNPKTALFFLSFIPQFISPIRGHTALQFLALGSVSVAMNTTVDVLVAAFAGTLAHILNSDPKYVRRQRAISGGGMMGLGLYVAASRARN